jgi:glycerate 2-kinase
MDPRPLLLDRFHTALAAVDPAEAVRRHLRLADGMLHCGGWSHPLRGRVVLVAAGKAGAPMAQAAEELLGARIARGVAVVKHGHGLPLARVQVIEAGHPVPDQAGVAGAAAIEAAVAGLGPDDLVLCCLSGGASALLPAPRAPLTLADKQAVTAALLASGADIAAMNTVRKHLARLKGGRLALACAPASVLTLALSDVPGDDPRVIGSGPTAADDSDDADAWALIRRHCDPARLPPAVQQLMAAPPQPWTARRLERCHYHLVASNALALAATGAAVRAAELTGEAWRAAESFCTAALATPPGTLVAAGGETTVTLGAKPGRGGRNQEFALAAARWIAAHQAPLTVLAAGSDGSDGPTDAAGGLVDGGTWARIRAAGVDPEAALAGHDAYPALAAAGDLLVTGPTRTNVMDLALAWRG